MTELSHFNGTIDKQEPLELAEAIRRFRSLALRSDEDPEWKKRLQFWRSEQYPVRTIDPTLSTRECAIPHQAFGRAQFAQAMERMARENCPPEQWQRYGVLFFDVNGLKSLRDCTSMQTATQYLRGQAQFFQNPNGTTRKWLETECGIRTMPFTAQGDEFSIFLVANQPLTENLLEQVITRYQEEISQSASLRQHLNFDDQRVLMNYGLTSKEKKSFASQPEQIQEERLREIRSTLPETFIPSVAGGWATLDAALVQAMTDGNGDDDGTFCPAVDGVLDAFLHRAEVRQRKNKKLYKDRLDQENPLLATWLKRNDENRRQELVIHTLGTVIGKIEEEVRRTLGDAKKGAAQHLAKRIQSLLDDEPLVAEVLNRTVQMIILETQGPLMEVLSSPEKTQR